MTISHMVIGAIQQTGGGGAVPVTGGPVANPGTASTDAETPVVINLIANDTHPEGDALTIVSVAAPAGTGSVFSNGDGTATFTPFAGTEGEVIISYVIRDSVGRRSGSTHTVTVAAPSTAPPVANPDTGTTPEQAAVTIDVAANDTHPLSKTFDVTAVSVPSAQGTVVNNNNGTITFTPAAGFVGSASVSYTITDVDGETASSTVAITVTDIAPVAVDDTETVGENSTSSVFNVRANDTHALAGETILVTAASVAPAEGTVAIVNSGQDISYTPAANFNGTATISYTITDETGSTDDGTVTVTVTPDPAPTSNPDTASTPQGVTIDVDVLANDTHPTPAQTLTVVTATLSTGTGTVAIVSNQVRFTPDPAFTGDATINYTIEDESGDQSSSTLTVTVNPDDVPTAFDDSVTTPESTAVDIDVLANDTHPVPDPLTIVNVSVLTGSGVATVIGSAPTQQVRFTPTEDWNGTATVEYTIEDANGSQDSAVITITVTPDPVPTAVDDTATTNEDVLIDIDALNNDTHPTPDDLLIVAASVAPAEGTVSVVGTFPNQQVRYTPASGFTGTATISYTVEDATGDQDIGEIVVTVNPDPAPTAVADSDTMLEDGSLLYDVLANDTHPTPAETLTVISATVNSGNGTAVVETNQVRVDPAADWNGTMVIEYTIEDSNGDQSTALFTVTVSPQDDPPVAVDDSGTTSERAAVTIDVLANDTNIDGDDLTIVAASVTAGSGTVAITGNVPNQQIEFTPADGFSGAATVNYTIEDPDLNQSSANVAITVTDVAPVAVDDTGTTAADTNVTVDVLANDTHAASDALTLISVTLDTPSQGTATVVGNQVSFTPAAGVSGAVSMSYVVQDLSGSQDTGVLVVTVGAAAGPWADPFDDWTGSLAYSRWINGATSGNSTQNSTMWSSRPGIGGAGDAVRWFTDGNDAGRIQAGTKTYDGFDPEPFSGSLIMRFRIAFDAMPTGKLYIYPQFNFMDGFSGYFDITPDATPAGSRGLGLSAGVSDVWFEEHASNGFWYFKARIDMAGATDTNGQIFWWLTDQDNTGDGLLDGGEALDMRVQDLTFEIE